MHMNPTAHTVAVIDTATVRTAKQLQDALSAMQGPGSDDRMLGETMKVYLVCETFSDGSEVYEIKVRPA